MVRKSGDIRCLWRRDIRELLEALIRDAKRKAKMNLNIIIEHNVPTTSSWSLQKIGTEEDRIDMLSYIKIISYQGIIYCDLCLPHFSR